MMENYKNPISNMVNLLNLTIKNLYLITDGNQEQVINYFNEMELGEKNIRNIGENYFKNLILMN